VNISNILHLALDARAKTVRVVRSANHDLKKGNALGLDVTILLQACMLNFTRCIGWFYSKSLSMLSFSGEISLAGNVK
jgi:hypothetical protein